MSDWVSVLVVFWVLWLIDGARVSRRPVFTWVGGVGRWTRTIRSRLSLPGCWPGSWRMATSDVPLSISPLGLCNRPAGSAGRPAEVPPRAEAWRWEEIDTVAVADGWIFVNGRPFCRQTGHVGGPEILALARLGPAKRASRIEWLIASWFRPAHLRRRAWVLRWRTRGPARLNAIVLVAFVALSVYVGGNISARLPMRWSVVVADLLPLGLLVLVMLHAVAVVTAWRAIRRLKPVGPEKRAGSLFSALLLPPQGLRLRALAGDGFFPPQHPVAAMAAWSGERARRQGLFNALADLSFPVQTAAPGELEADILRDFRSRLGSHVQAVARAAGIEPSELLAEPRPDSPASCSYCPRCRDQFVDARAVCPNGVKLRALDRRCPGRR